MISKILIKENDLQKRIDEIAKKINADFGETKFSAVVILKGAKRFFTETSKKLHSLEETKFIQISNYGTALNSPGEIRLVSGLETDLLGKNVMIFEDIIDSGHTLKFLKNYLREEKGAENIFVCALLEKPSRRKTEIKIDYLGFKIPDLFVVGFGMEYNNEFGELPYIAVLDIERMQN